MNICVTCNKPLTLNLDSDDEDGDIRPGSSGDTTRTVPDSVELTCGCYFHWSVRPFPSLIILAVSDQPNLPHRECLLDAYSMSECPNCGANITSLSSTSEEQVLCNLNNEGGLQEGLDVMPLLVEASYLKTYPEERKARAFVEFAGEGDVVSMIDMLGGRDEDGDGDEVANGEEEGQGIDLLRYQDPISGMSSALHAAVASKNVIVAWLLLWLASGLGMDQFPKEIVAHAQELGLSREGVMEKVDIRSLKDSAGMTAKQRAAALGGVWTEWLDHGWLDDE